MREETKKKKKNPFNYQLFYRRTALIVYDIISVVASSFLALLIRYDFELDAIPEEFLLPIRQFLWMNILLTLIIFYFFRLYHSLWAFAGETELQNLVMACLCCSVVTGIGVNFFKLSSQAVPDSYYFLYFFILLMFLFASRFSYRFLRSRKHKLQNRKNSISVMIIGAGEAGNTIIKEIVTSNYSTMVIRCIIDDDRNKWGQFIQGIKVVGGREKIIESADLYDIDEIFLAIPSASPKQIREILEICKETSCKLRSLPGLYQLVNGEVNVSKLRDVEVEDLLGREPIRVDLDSILGYVQNKVVLVTGGGGSIGSELCRQVATHKPARLIIFDIYENNAYDIQQELKEKFPDLKLTVLIGSVRNTNRINSVFETWKPDIVYHAAAHKHVPLMEDSPNEAIKNNVFGTWKTAMAAAMNGTQKFVMISTDKAVNPTNIMGASKRICEMIVQTFNRHYDTEFVAVRFGNVLGSNGSVIPLFKKQIAAGGPVTVTHPDIIRYFMTIPEAVSLVLQAGAYAKGGEIFVLDMGEPVRILDLAKNLIRLSGYKVDEDIKIVFTGLRPGEKLYEELLMDEEGMQDTENRLIHIGRPIELDERQFFVQLKRLEDESKNECKDIRPLIREIVPTYHYQEKKENQ
ncbi:MAG TPA: polysaccharide biosynthesis protein [Candidatus Eisenbergiella pullicola]|nr:polysaccharide biosynthesis protein [Candidatus Eisenbergiella pullicola]